MTKIVVNGVDGNFSSQVAKHIQNLLPKDDLLFTAPREEALKPYQEQGIKTAVTDFNSLENLVKVFENANKVLPISMPFVGEKTL